MAVSVLSEYTSNELVGFIRLLLQDFKEVNVLLSGEELSDLLIKMNLAITVDEFNKFPPKETAYGTDFHPIPSVIIRGTILNLLQMSGILMSRNDLSYNAGDISLNLNKSKEYIMWCKMFYKRYDEEVRAIKQYINMASAYSSVSSGYKIDRSQTI